MLSFEERQEVNSKINLLRKAMLEEAIDRKTSLQVLNRILSGRRVNSKELEVLKEEGIRIVADFFAKNPKEILYIVGDSLVPDNKIFLMAQKVGIPSENISLFTDYMNVKRDFHVAVLKKHSVGIILGPMPHSIPGIEGHPNLRSFLRAKTTEEKFPDILVVKAGAKSPKMNACSLKRALEDFAFALYEKQMQESI